MKKKINPTDSYQNENFIRKIISQSKEETLNFFQTSAQGLSSEAAQKRTELYGQNIFDKKKISFFREWLRFVCNLFNFLLLLVAILSIITDIIVQESEKKDYSTLIVIILIFVFSNIIYWFQEIKFAKVSHILKQITQIKVFLKRNNQIKEFLLQELVVGDIVHLSSGDTVPADIKLLETKDFFIKEVSLTGESDPVEKNAVFEGVYPNLLEDPRMIWMGTTVVSGYAQGVVVAIGNDTYLGFIHRITTQKKTISTTQKDINSITKLLSYLILGFIPFIFIANFVNNPSIFKDKNEILKLFTFALTTVIGLVPEMLPLIISSYFLIGVYRLYKKKAVVKNLYSIQDLGSMNILFTDKTGTLTEEKIVLDGYYDLNYINNKRVLKYAFLNSYFQTGIKSNIDLAIIEKTIELDHQDINIFSLNQDFNKIDEKPFDFKRRMVSVIVQNQNKTYQKVISKGAIEEIINICDYMEFTDPVTYDKQLIPIDKAMLLKKITSYNEKGFYIIGVAYKNSTILSNSDISNANIEKNMIMAGFLTFFDIPKSSALPAITFLKENNVKIKILTGDNAVLTQIIAAQINLDNRQSYLLGTDLDKFDDDTLYQKLQDINILAKLNPEQKAKIVTLFKNKGNIVGFIGDGINDAPAMQSANLSISVDSGVDIAKETSDIILLKKDLIFLCDGLLEGRKIYTNMLKYVKFTLAGNFGNILSIILASLVLKFIPLLPAQILFLNLVYDISCLALSVDNVDETYLKKPRKWNIKNILCFIILFGGLTFIFDIIFASGLYHIDSDFFNSSKPEKFRSSWFLFSIWTQIFNIFSLRTDRLFKKSSISKFILVILFLVGISVTSIVLGAGSFLHFVNPFRENIRILLFFILTMILYLFCLSLAKRIFISKFKELL